LTQAQLRQPGPLPEEWTVYVENAVASMQDVRSLLQILAAQPAQHTITLMIRSAVLAQPIWLSANVAPKTTLPGRHSQTVYTFSDVTDRKQNELSLLRQAERERLVSAIAQRIRQSLDLDNILRTAVAEVRQLLETDRVIFGCFQPPDGMQVVAESARSDLSPILGITFSHLIAAERYEFYQQGHVFVSEDTQRTGVDPAAQSVVEQYQVKALVAMPILQGEHLWGLLIAHHCQPRSWMTADIEVMRQLATQIMIAIQQSQLYEQVQEFNTRLESQVAERTEQLQQSLEFEATLKRITDKVRDSLEEDQILQTAVQELGKVLEAVSCNAALYDLNREVSAVCYEYTVSSVTYKGRVMQMANRAELYRQLRRGLYFQFCSLYSNSPRGQAAMLACPILDNEGAIGDLWVVDEKGHGFDERQIRLVQQVATQCAIAIRQARLYQASKTQVEELERLNRLKDDFLSTVSHELRTPMANMKMAIHMLKVNASQMRDRQSRYLEILEAECQREVELISDLLDLQRLEASSFTAVQELVTPQDWLPSLVESFQTRIAEYEQTLQVHCAANVPPFLSDMMALRRIVTELLNNACKYTPVGGTIEISVSAASRLSGGGLEVILQIRNQAMIPATELPHIFDKFYRVPNGDPWSRGGTGLGLALVKKLVEQLNSSIHVDSRHGWTTFEVRLPVNAASVASRTV
jgi:signal transduction histidine kinase